MTDVVRKNYDLHRENLLSTDRTPLEDLKRQEQDIVAAEQLLADLRGQPEVALGFGSTVDRISPSGDEPPSGASNGQ